MSTLPTLRAAFPHADDRIYLNHAATAPLSKPVVEAMGSFTQDRHAGQIENFETFAPIMEETRQRSGRLLGCDPSRVEFVQNTSTALHFLAEGFGWQANDRVAIPACEFPANVYPFMHLARKGVDVDFIPHHESTLTLRQIEDALTPSTRMLSISWVQFLSGYQTDLVKLGELCAERDIVFCVDAIQGLGALNIDVKEAQIDFLAAGGHKWLMAPQGVGLLYCSEDLQGKLTPPAGWLHGPVDWEQFFDYELQHYEDARRFRLGTFNSVGICGLNAALKLREETGALWWETMVLELAGFLSSKLQEEGYVIYGDIDTPQSGIVTIEHDEAEVLQEALREQSIDVAVRNGLLRISPNAYQTTDKMRRVVDSISEYDAQY